MSCINLCTHTHTHKHTHIQSESIRKLLKCCEAVLLHGAWQPQSRNAICYMALHTFRRARMRWQLEQNGKHGAGAGYAVSGNLSTLWLAASWANWKRAERERDRGGKRERERAKVDKDCRKSLWIAPTGRAVVSLNYICLAAEFGQETPVALCHLLPHPLPFPLNCYYLPT